MSAISNKQNKLRPGSGIIMHNGPFGIDIMVDDNYITNILGSADSTASYDDSWIDQKINDKVSKINKTKPIFILGFPLSIENDVCHSQMERIFEMLHNEYHVICVKNMTDVYSAKVYSVDGIESVDIDDIKRYVGTKNKIK